MGVSCMGCVNTSADPRFVSLRVNVTFSLSLGIGEITDVKTCISGAKWDRYPVMSEPWAVALTDIQPIPAFKSKLNSVILKFRFHKTKQT